MISLRIPILLRWLKVSISSLLVHQRHSAKRHCSKADTSPISLFPTKLSQLYLVHDLGREHCNSINSMIYLGIPRYAIIYGYFLYLKNIVFLILSPCSTWKCWGFGVSGSLVLLGVMVYPWFNCLQFGFKVWLNV